MLERFERLINPFELHRHRRDHIELAATDPLLCACGSHLLRRHGIIDVQAPTHSKALIALADTSRSATS